MRELLPEAEGQKRLLIDTNLLVLYVVGTVNANRVSQFKRTQAYTVADYQLLYGVMQEFAEIWTVPQVMAEVSNLTDLSGHEYELARGVLRRSILEIVESQVSSRVAAGHALFAPLGITDAAIASAAKETGCAVLTDDLELFLRLLAADVQAFNFTHLREKFQIV
jgi:predicted nucleic acid-binding protein